jgi:hypothetical protein
MRAERRLRPLPPEPATLLSEGRVAEAVQALRESHGIGAREAKKWIDAHVADDPMLRVQLESQKRAWGRKVFFWVLAIDVIAVAAIIYYLLYLRR